MKQFSLKIFIRYKFYIPKNRPNRPYQKYLGWNKFFYFFNISL